MDTSSAPFFGLDGLHVLSVDDDGDTLDIVRAILEDAGAVVTTAFSAREGLEMLQRERPAVLVSVIVMPTEDGFWLIAQVRGLSPAHGGRTPAAALTVLTGAADRAQILGAGFQYHIPKPIQPKKFLGIVAVLAIKE